MINLQFNIEPLKQIDGFKSYAQCLGIAKVQVAQSGDFAFAKLVETDGQDPSEPGVYALVQITIAAGQMIWFAVDSNDNYYEVVFYKTDDGRGNYMQNGYKGSLRLANSSRNFDVCMRWLVTEAVKRWSDDLLEKKSITKSK